MKMAAKNDTGKQNKGNFDIESLLYYLIEITDDERLKNMLYKDLSNLNQQDKQYINIIYKNNYKKLFDWLVKDFIERNTFENEQLGIDSLKLTLKIVMNKKHFEECYSKLNLEDIKRGIIA